MDFDHYAETYEREVETATRFAGMPPEFFLEVKVIHLLRTLRQKFGALSRLRVLDVGCGVGVTDQLLKAHLPHLVGVDVSGKSLEVARVRNPELTYHHSADGNLPFVNSSFDVVFAICVWHHVPHSQWTAFVTELSRVLVQQGLLLIYEHNPWNPFTRLVVSRCSFDEDAVLVSPYQATRKVRQVGFAKTNTDYLCFLPFKSGIIRRWETAMLRKIPLGAQYALHATRL
jgi:SAM-dependent methyltransferase